MIEVVVALLMFWDGESKSIVFKKVWLHASELDVWLRGSSILTCLTNAYVVKQKQKSTWVKRVSRNFTSNEKAQQKKKSSSKAA